MEDYHECINGRRREQDGFMKMRDATGYKDWAPCEEEFVINLYNKGYGPKKIHDRYSLQEDFTKRTYNAVSSFLDSKRKGGLISKLRINWDEDIGFFALALLERYGRNNNFVSKNSKSLDDYFFDSKGIITRSKLSNFYRRFEKQRYEEYKNEEQLAA